MGDDVRAPFDGPAVHGGGEGVIHNQGNAVPVGGRGEHLNIEHAQGRICDGFTENGLCVRPESGVQLFRRAVRRDEGEFNAHLFHRDGKEVIGAAVDGGAGHHMISGVGDVEHGVKIRRLAGGSQHCGGAAFQRTDLRGHGVTGRILQAGIEIAGGFQIKQLAHVLAGVVFEGGGLDDGDLAGFSVFRRVAALDAYGFDGCHDVFPSFFIVYVTFMVYVTATPRTHPQFIACSSISASSTIQSDGDSPGRGADSSKGMYFPVWKIS